VKASYGKCSHCKKPIEPHGVTCVFCGREYVVKKPIVKKAVPIPSGAFGWILAEDKTKKPKKRKAPKKKKS
jgi:hypothetical protein